MVYTVRLSGGQGGRNAFEKQLRTWNVLQKNSRGNHPQTCGKAERFQRTLKDWLSRQPVQPTTLVELQTLIDMTWGNGLFETCSRMRAARSKPRFE